LGPLNAATEVAWHLGQTNVRKVYLLGIAGSYRDVVPLGTATQFRRVSLSGIGAGTGAMHKPLRELGGAVITASPHDREQQGIPLHFAPSLPSEEQLLTVCAAAANPLDVENRLDQFPRAAAEDMEGFAVAAACERFGVPLHIIRGISNAAGDRDRDRWQIAAALRAVAELFREVFEHAV
jgi:futalosine hydrolase